MTKESRHRRNRAFARGNANCRVNLMIYSDKLRARRLEDCYDDKQYLEYNTAAL